MNNILFTSLMVITSTVVHKPTGAYKITGEKEVVYAQNQGTAEFKWTWDAPPNAIQQISVSAVDPKAPSNIELLARKISSGNYQLTQKGRYANRITLEMPQQGLIMRIRSMAINDEGIFECRMEFVDINTNTAISRTTLVVLVAPVIDTRFNKLDKTEDESASLICKTTAGNPKPMEFRWYKRNKTGNYDPVTNTVIAYDQYNLNVTASRAKKGQYKCEVRNRGGMATHVVTLNVRYKPVLTLRPINRTVFENRGETEFNCEADGNAGMTHYMWYQYEPIPSQDIDNVLKTNTDLAKYVSYENNRKRLKFVKPPRKYKGKYFCAGRNDLGTGKAEGAYLNVTYVPGEIFIATDNGVINGDEGRNLSVRCTSDANPPPSYTWQKKTKDQTTGATRFVTILEGSYTGFLHLNDLTTNDTAEYKCIAVNYPNIKDRDEKGHAEKTVPIKVRFGPRQTNFTVNGLNGTRIEITEDKKFELKCESHSEPPATYNIQRRPDVTKLNSDSSVGIYVIDQLKRNQEGTYVCISRNSILGNLQEREVQVVVAVAPKSQTPIPGDEKTEEGSFNSISCRGEGKPPPKVHWQKYGANITGDGVIEITYKEGSTNDQLITTIESQLKFNGIRYTDSASYSCIIYNSAGKVNLTAKREVEYAPKITVKPQDRTVTEGDQQIVSFICEAIANPKEIRWTWYFDNGEGNQELSPNVGAENTFTREIPNRDHNGVYTCVPKNTISKSDGSGQSASAKLVVQYRPTITTKPQEIVIANISQTVTLYCEAIGVPKPEIIWEKSSDGKFRRIGNRLTLSNIQVTDAGFYTCSAKNIIDGDSKRSKILVRHQPIITTTNPADTKFGVEVGDEAKLICVVNSYPAPTIKWKYSDGTKSGSEIKSGLDGFTVQIENTEFGGSSTLSVQVTDLLQGTNYICEATNELGTEDQVFQILQKGKPDAPIKLEAKDVIQPTVPVTVNITFSWIPGYSGGFPVDYILLYKERNEQSFREQFLRAPEGNKYVFTYRKVETEYVFSIRAKNQKGSSPELTPYVKFKTRSPPPQVVEVQLQPHDDGTSILVSWQILHDPGVTRKRAVNKWEYAVVRYRMADLETTWTEEIIRNVSRNGTYLVTDLNGNERYEFHFILYDSNGNFGRPFNAGIKYPNEKVVSERRAGLTKTDYIAIGAGIGGFLLLLTVVILFICLRRKNSEKPFTTTYNNGRVTVDIASGTIKSAGGYSDVVRASYLHDDPYAMDSSELDDTEEKLPPPGYDEYHYRKAPDYTDRGEISTFHHEEPTPSYTSFGRLPKNTSRSSQDRAGEKTRAAEISRGVNRFSRDEVEPEVMDPLLRRSITDLDDTYNESERNRRNYRNSRDMLPEEDQREPPSFGLRSPPSDEGGLNNRVPGAFGDRANNQRNKKMPPKYGDPSLQSPPPDVHPISPTSGRSSPPSSVASSKPYRSDNEYIEDAEDHYVGYLV